MSFCDNNKSIVNILSFFLKKQFQKQVAFINLALIYIIKMLWIRRIDIFNIDQKITPFCDFLINIKYIKYHWPLDLTNNLNVHNWKIDR